jgi:dihydrolipoamide dehydrogenase
VLTSLAGGEVMATAEEFDMVVLGGGPGGYAAALYGASAGLSVAVVEKDKVGGACLHRGCIPAKEFLETASVFRTVGGAKEFGVEAGQPSVDFAASQARKAKVVDQLWRGLSGLMRSRGITTVEGTGRLLGGRLVEVEAADGPARQLAGRAVVLATGSVPRSLPGFELEGERIMSSDQFLDLSRLPSSAAVIGGGAIGCEFASLMADLGTQVTLLEALPKLLPGCDSEVVAVVERSFRRRGIDVRTGVSVTGQEPGPSGTTVRLAGGESVTVDAVVVSVGRRPFTDGVLAEGAGVERDGRGFVKVDSRMRTTAAGVWAVGDVVDSPQLAHVGFAEAIVAVRDILGEDVVPVDYSKVPWGIYCHPEVAFAGYSEEAALEAGFDVVVKKDPFGGNSRARILGETDGLVKVVAERQEDGRVGRLLGVHMVGPWVTEQLGQGYLSVNWEATPEEVGSLVQPHPTLSEAFGETALALTGRGLHIG